MKTVIISDIHGQDEWKAILSQEEPFDRVVFLGDYFDSFNIPATKQIQNFCDIIFFRDARPDEVSLLLGNHDYHYLDMNERYSGFQKGYQYLIREHLESQVKKFQICKRVGDIYCTHAGISKTFLNRFGIAEDDNMEDNLNDLFRYKPLSFKFCGTDDAGNDVTQSPIWIRPKSLHEDSIDKTQIVGHTVVHRINCRGSLYFTDTLQMSKEYITITDGKITINNFVL